MTKILVSRGLGQGFSGIWGPGTEEMYVRTSQDPSWGLRRPQEVQNNGFGVQGVQGVAGPLVPIGPMEPFKGIPIVDPPLYGSAGSLFVLMFDRSYCTKLYASVST